MYGVDNGLRIDYLKGLYLASIELGVAQVALHFRSPGSTNVGSSLFIRGQFSASQDANDELVFLADCSRGISSLPQQEQGIAALTSLIHMLECNVVAAEISRQDNSIRLSLENGASVSVFDSNAPYYESFEIHHGEDVYIV